jgi:hypothetical protein
MYRALQLRSILNKEKTKWEQELTNLENSASVQTLKKKDQKITDLETSLLNLAKQKVKGKKEFEQVLKELEKNWQNKTSHYQKTASEIEKIIDSKLVIFMGKEKVLNYLREIAKKEPKEWESVD